MRHGGLADNPSASSSEAFIRCPASHVLPQRKEYTERAEKGTDGHDYLTARINQRPIGAERGRSMAGKFPLEKLLAGKKNIRSETAYAVNVKKRIARFIGTDLKRAYGELLDYEVPVTLDVDAEDDDSSPWIADFKFGLWSTEWQIVIQAMAVSYVRPHRASRVSGGVVFIDGQTGGEEWSEERRTYWLEELDDRASEMAHAFDRVAEIHAILKAGAVPPLSEGPWCKYCGAYPECPAKWKLAQSMMSELKTMHGEAIKSWTIPECGKAWERLREIETCAESVREKLTLRMAEAPFPTSNGKEVYLLEQRGWKFFQKEKTLALLRRLGASSVEIEDSMVKRADSFRPQERKRK